MEGDRRRTLLAAAVAVLAVLALFLVAFEHGSAPGTPDVRLAGRDESGDSLDAAGDARTPPDDRRAPPGPSADDEDLTETPIGFVAVRVIAQPERAPVPGAEVRLLVETAQSLELGWASLTEGADAPPAITGPDGRAQLAWGAADGPKRLVTVAPGFTVAEVRLEEPARRTVLIALQRGLAIEGRVVDATGSGVREVVVEGRAVRRPRSGLPTAESVPMTGGERVRAKADEEGRFRLEGLSPGSYRVSPASGGWLATADRVPSTAFPVPGYEGVLAEAGARDVRLVVARHAAIVLRLLDARTGEPIDAAWSTASVRLPGGAAVAAHASFIPRSPGLPAGLRATEDAAGPSASRVRVTVPWDGSAREAAVDLRAAGYKPARTSATLFVSPDAGSAEVGPAQIVTLEPEASEGGCRLVLDCGREARGLLRPTTRMLTHCRPSDSVRTHRAGRLLDGDRVEFRDLPAGEGVVEVWDGWTRSKPVRVVLQPERAPEAKAEFGPLSGAVFELREERGGRVFDADVLLVAPEGHDHGLPDRTAATQLAPGLQVVVPLEPGRYRFAVNKIGVGYDAGTFEVAAGSVVTVRARLGPIRRFDTGQRVLPRPR